MGFGQGLSGLNAAAQNLDVVGNNIANSATVGFKSASVSFADVYAQSRVGMGVAVAAVNQRFTAGNLRASGGELDIAIDGQNGLFRLQDANGSVSYSRNGEFLADKNNYIVNAQGKRLTGYIGGGNSTTLGPLMIPYGNIAPNPTSSATTAANFDANAAVISQVDIAESLGQVTLTDSGGTTLPAANFRVSETGVISWVDAAGTPVAPPADGTYTSGAGITVELAGGQIVSGFFDDTAPNATYVTPVIGQPFSPSNADSFTHSLPMEVFDSLGNSHQMMQYFVKRAGASGTESQWDVYYTMDGKPTDAPIGGGPVQMTFSSAGRMTSNPDVMIGATSPGAGGSPAQPLAITLDYSGSTQFGGGFTPNFTQDGYATGEYSGLMIGTNGDVVANYTNGEKQVVGTLALADFNNLQGLKPVGGNAWEESPDSGQAILGRPGDNGLATIKGQALEESNVDMSAELVNMIIAQRTYQANAQTIKTQDTLMQTLISMR